MVVSQPERAVALLQHHQIAAVVNDVVMVEADDRPGGLSRMLGMLADANLQVDYSYTAASARAGVAVMVFRFSDNARALDLLTRNGVALVAADD
jgi:hypothetical protein